MQRQSYQSMVAALSGQVDEIQPWDLVDELAADAAPLLLDIRCPHEFQQARLDGAINVPRGILELAADYGYDDTVPELVEARERRVIVICWSGNRSMLAAYSLQLMGFSNVASLRTGLRGWNDYDQPLLDSAGEPLDPDWVDQHFSPPISPQQMGESLSQAA